MEKVEKTLECSRCLAQLDVIHFSKTQSKLSSILRKCKKCVELVSVLANSNGTPLPLNVAKSKIAEVTRATQPIEAVVSNLSMASEADLLYSAGDRVQLQNLTSAPKHNGKHGTVQERVGGEPERYRVALDSGDVLSVKSLNLLRMQPQLPVASITEPSVYHAHGPRSMNLHLPSAVINWRCDPDWEEKTLQLGIKQCFESFSWAPGFSKLVTSMDAIQVLRHVIGYRILTQLRRRYYAFSSPFPRHLGVLTVLICYLKISQCLKALIL